MLEQIAALRARKDTLIPMINLDSRIGGGEKDIAIRMLLGEKAEVIGATYDLSKYKVTMIARETCAKVDPMELPETNPLGRLDADIEKHLSNKSINVLKQAGIFTKADLAALIRDGGQLAILDLYGCGQKGAAEIWAAAVKNGLLPEQGGGGITEKILAPAQLDLLGGEIPEPLRAVLDDREAGSFMLFDPASMSSFFGDAATSAGPRISDALAEVVELTAKQPVPEMKLGANGTVVSIDGRIICTFNLRDLTLPEAFTFAKLLTVAAEAVRMAPK